MTSAIIVDHSTNTAALIGALQRNEFEEVCFTASKGITIFSTTEIEKYIEEEENHEKRIFGKDQGQSLQSMSSGERKKILLKYLMQTDPEVLILVNPYDNLDQQTRETLKNRLENMAGKLQMVQIITRASDALNTTERFFTFSKGQLQSCDPFSNLHIFDETKAHFGTHEIPFPKKLIPSPTNILVILKNVSVAFNNKRVLQNVHWKIMKNDFWQLKGPNGSGKSTLLNMLTAENSKAYGQDITLFGHQKGQGETIWDIKKYIGYFTPAMIDRFKGYHTVESMLISGLHDSVGLYQKPTEEEKNIAHKWLKLLRLSKKKTAYFNELSTGEKRLVMTTRAMIKHPPLLILDEPTVGLDDATAHFFIQLVNKFAKESETAIVFVSHRTEIGLLPKQVIELFPDPNGSIAKISTTSL